MAIEALDVFATESRCLEWGWHRILCPASSDQRLHYFEPSSYQLPPSSPCTSSCVEFSNLSPSLSRKSQPLLLQHQSQSLLSQTKLHSLIIPLPESILSFISTLTIFSISFCTSLMIHFRAEAIHSSSKVSAGLYRRASRM